ncbi:hypothetical protein FHS31_000922 [Sphingomonas vulcanisoli]|uniref:Uncharacterized protein n=1 Tax=Sphingomonas vulcanisoli TaxID=1658060 RepID=A0ABX0TPH8_9SPHN|nr:hypothetical protein [Sphingomonas vulcanisoli]
MPELTIKAAGGVSQLRRTALETQPYRKCDYDRSEELIQ